ncbi:MAG: nuclease-related domain-containing protein, partial [Actinomycetes bacterium]
MTGNPPPQEAGDPGASLQAEYDKRKRVREERIRAAHPKLGGLILGLSDDPQSTRAFAAGAAGERAAAAALEKRCGDSVLFLHNRRLHSSSRGDIDHVAVTGNGVWVIDTKHYKGKKVEVRRSGGLFSERREQLFIGGRDNTKLLVSVAKQVFSTAVRWGWI